MKRKCIRTDISLGNPTENIYKYFEEGWILDPWLHGTNRPWTAQRELLVHDTTSAELSPQTAYIWNLVLLEEGDDPTDPEWLLKNCPVRSIPIPKIVVDAIVKSPVVDEALINYDQVAEYVNLGYEMPEDKRWAKNRLAVLRADGAIDHMEGTGGVHEELFDKIPLERLQKYLSLRVEELAKQ